MPPVTGALAEVVAAVIILKPPMLDANRLEERLDSELIVRLAGHGFTDKRGMRQGVRGIAAAGAGIKSQLRSPLIAAVAQDIFPRAVVGRAGRLGTDARGVVEQLFDGDSRLARIAERLRPRDELERRIVELHLLGRAALLALLGGNR